MDKIFGKKKTVEQQLRDQDREMRRNQRGLQRDRAGLEKGKNYFFFEKKNYCDDWLKNEIF